MKKLLFISPCAPYDKVDHAGGQVHNFYVKTIQKNPEFDMTLITLCWQREVAKLDLDDYHIKRKIFVMDRTKFHRYFRMGFDFFSYFNPFDRYCSLLLPYEIFHLKAMIKAYYKECRRENSFPEAVILQWTQAVFLLDYVKKLFPVAKVISVEEDVSFLSFERRIKLAEGVVSKKIAGMRFEKLRKLELSLLEKSDLVVNNNAKDLNLLEKNGIDSSKLFLMPAYFKNYGHIRRNSINNAILYFGAMGRPENYNSAIWFIDNVMPMLKDDGLEFVVVGSNPPKCLLDKACDTVSVKGFQENVDEYFEHSLCLAAPLVLGAGVKIKILEAMSAGIPVLTNDIGIEGIPVKDGVHYFHCTSPQDYARRIKELKENRTSENKTAVDFINGEYNISGKFGILMEIILNM